MSKDLTTAHPIDKAVGVNVRLRRRALGLSQTDLANAIGLTFQQVQKYERGSNRISCSKLVEIAAYLNCAPASLLPISAMTDAAAAPWFEQVRELAYKHPDLFTELGKCNAAQLNALTEFVATFATLPTSPSIDVASVAQSHAVDGFAGLKAVA